MHRERSARLLPARGVQTALKLTRLPRALLSPPRAEHGGVHDRVPERVLRREEGECAGWARLCCCIQDGVGECSGRAPGAREFRVFDSVRALHADSARPRFRFAAEQGTVARGEPPAVSCQHEAGKGGLLRGNRRRDRGGRSRSGHADVNELAHRHRLLVNYCFDLFGLKSLSGHWDSWTGERRRDGRCRQARHARTHARRTHAQKRCIKIDTAYKRQRVTSTSSLGDSPQDARKSL